MTISIDAEKHLTKFNTHSWLKKDPHQTRNRKKLPQHIKAKHEKPTAKVIHNGERTKDFLLRSGTSQGFLLSSLLSNIVLEILARAIRQKREIKGIQLRIQK